MSQDIELAKSLNPIIAQVIPTPSQISVPIPQVVPQLPPSIPAVVCDVITIFGYGIQKKYFYLVCALVVLAVGYFIWRWYTNRKTDDDESSDDSENSDELSDNDENMPLYTEHQQPLGQAQPQPQLGANPNEQNIGSV